MLTYLLLQFFAGLLVLGVLIYLAWKKHWFSWLWSKIKALTVTGWVLVGIVVVAGGMYSYGSYPYPLNFAMPPMMRSEAPGGLPASIPIPMVLEFFQQVNEFEYIENIGADPADVPAPITILAEEDTTVDSNVITDESGENVLKNEQPETGDDEVVKIELEAQEVISEIADGITFNYWTYNQQVPGPMLRVSEGDNVELSLTNHATSLHSHNIDLHAVTGPGGGATVTKVEPGETKTFFWKALNPGLYVYHCATANISTHNAHGQYGMILVEPKEGLPEVDKEFYIMQGELYTEGGLGKKGLVPFDSQALLDGIPSYVTFNGIVEDTPRMQAEVGDTIRMYVGNGGLNQISSFHVIGEIFDNVYPEAAIGGEPLHNVQTTAVLPGGATIVEFKVEVPGNYVLVDHALARMNKGAWAILEVKGEANPEVYDSLDGVDYFKE